jgi:hypothetical protein
LPKPPKPEVIVRKLELLVASQEQLDPAVTATVPVPPLAAKDWLSGEIA